MLLYLDLIPISINNIILSYLEYNDMIDDMIDNIILCEYEEIFYSRFPYIAKLLKVDKYNHEYMEFLRISKNSPILEKYMTNGIFRGDEYMFYNRFIRDKTDLYEHSINIPIYRIIFNDILQKKYQIFKNKLQINNIKISKELYTLFNILVFSILHLNQGSYLYDYIYDTLTSNELIIKKYIHFDINRYGMSDLNYLNSHVYLYSIEYMYGSEKFNYNDIDVLSVLYRLIYIDWMLTEIPISAYVDTNYKNLMYEDI